MRRYAHRYGRQYAWLGGHRYVAHSGSPVTAAANRMAVGVADLGSLATYPLYCFPNYGSCRVHWYR
jgi:hypothetical protein